jgi:hypothetical protein
VQLFSYAVNREKRVRANHALRQVKAARSTKVKPLKADLASAREVAFVDKVFGR